MARASEGVDGDYQVDDLASLDQAGEADLSFLDNVKYKEQFQRQKPELVSCIPMLRPWPERFTFIA